MKKREVIDHSDGPDLLSPVLFDAILPPSTVAPGNNYSTVFDDSLTEFDNTRWHRRWIEEIVYRMRMLHSGDGEDYDFRIGKSGQIYSILARGLELMPPQNSDHAWIDDCTQLTTNQYDMHDSNLLYAVGYTHQGGIYRHTDRLFFASLYEENEMFFSPVVASRVDDENTQYGTLTLSMIPVAPTPNRGDILMYQNNRDLGGGIIEVTYIAYNYNSTIDYRAQTDVGIWGAARRSSVPNLVMSAPDGSYGLHVSRMGDDAYITDFNKTGGWVAATQDINDPEGLTFAYVFGTESTLGDRIANKFVGLTDTMRDDFLLIAPTYRLFMRPGTCYYIRIYLIIGSLADVAEKANMLQAQADFGFLEFTQTESPTIPLYLTEKNGQTALTDKGEGEPAFYVYAQPVANSKPLYLVYETATSLYKATCDPYMTMTRYPVPGDPQGRDGVRPYDQSTDIVKIFGYVVQEEFIEEGMETEYTRLDGILTDTSYYPAEGIYDIDVMVRTTPN